MPDYDPQQVAQRLDTRQEEIERRREELHRNGDGLTDELADYDQHPADEGTETFEQEREWVRGFWSALEPWHTTVYVNFLSDEGEERVRTAYGDAKYERLKTLKRTAVLCLPAILASDSCLHGMAGKQWHGALH